MRKRSPRVMREESLPCNLDRRLTVAEIPASARALKLLSILDELARRPIETF